jgi:mannose-1-phosphate guanylyltransferase/phosphomannomutase
VGIEVLESIGFKISKNCEDQDIFYLNDDGLEIITLKNKVLREESLMLLTALIFFKENIQAGFCVPVYACDDVEEIARKYGGKVQRISSLLNDEFLNQSHLLSIDLLNDPVRCICHIACYCISNNTTIDVLLEEIPQSFLIKKDVECIEIGRAALMKNLLNEAKKGRYELNEGIKIYNENGSVLIIPKNHKDEYKIYAQSHTKEYAQEICDFYQNKINLLKNKHVKKI